MRDAPCGAAILGGSRIYAAFVDRRLARVPTEPSGVFPRAVWRYPGVILTPGNFDLSSIGCLPQPEVETGSD
jgi:hypothetical protein